MKRSSFIHLHAHSHYSLLDGACKIESLVDAAKRSQMHALALTDHGNLFGAVEFYQYALKQGVKPILGYEAYLAPGKLTDKTLSPGNRSATSHLTLLVKDEQGYHNLMRLASIAYLEGFYYKPRIDIETLSRYRDGLVCLSGCLNSRIAHEILSDQPERALKTADEFRQIFQDDFYLEVQQHGINNQIKMMKGELEISKRLGIPIVATNDIHYLTEEDAHVHDILLCIATNKKVTDQDRLKLSSNQLYFKSSAEMKKLFAETPEAITNTLVIADKCNLVLSFGEQHLPKFVPPAGKNSKQFIQDLCTAGLKKRYGKKSEPAESRLNYELDVVEKMGFIDYFLIVWDLVRFARENHISVGPGRGSAAGSILSYVLEITDVDPLRYGLLFERFMNPGRRELPDIDIDFSQEGRGKIINYARTKYGMANVAQVITFGTLKARAAVRDVGRALGLPFGEVDRIAKRIPPTIGITLKEAMAADHELKELIKQKAEVKNLFKISMRLEGLVRHASTHAAAVVMADKPLINYVPLYRGEDIETTQYSREIAEKVGLLKIDILGILTLNVIDKCLELIQRVKKQSIDIQTIPLDDQKTYELLGRGETKGVFQLESSGMRDLLEKIRPNSFEDIIAILALYRPGPLKSGMVDTYIKCKHKESQVEYLHPSLESILKETNGLILYQEQAMKIAEKVAGFSLAEADDLRKAMGKKILDLVARYRTQFISGAHKNGLSKSLAGRIFELIEYFAGYGFNKSHSAAYALTSYRTAYLKANYPLAYLAALLTCHRDQSDKIVGYIDDCKRMGIEVLPPDINKSDADVTVSGNKIRFGLAGVKNVGEKAVINIVNERNKQGLFKSIYDLCERVDTQMVDRSVLESLIKAGAFDSLGYQRAALVMSLEQVVKVGDQRQHDKKTGQLNFLAAETDDKKTGSSVNEGLPLPKSFEWPEEEMLSYEREMLGFYVTKHPLTKYEGLIKEIASDTIVGLAKVREGKMVKVGGIITGITTKLLKGSSSRSEKSVYFKLRDLTGVVDTVIYPDEFSKNKDLIRNDRIVFVKGLLDFRKGAPMIKVKNVASIEEGYEKLADRITINLSSVGLEDQIIQGLHDIFLVHPGTCPVFMNLVTPENQKISLRVGNNYFITPSSKLISDIDDLLGSGHLTFN